MTNEEYEFILFDRIEKIKQINEEYDLEHNAYISFSGGKDSTVLSHLIDLALPDNKIPRVFIDTGIEYNMIKEFVLKKVSQDQRFIMVKPTKNIKKVLEEYGYPFKSKRHSHMVAIYQHSGISKAVKKYIDGVRVKDGQEKDSLFKCPNILKYQFEGKCNLKISELCCYKLKKEPMAKWTKESGKTIDLTGMRRDEGGQRANIDCIVTNSDGQLIKFHPLAPVDDDFMEWFIEAEKIELATLYYPPYCFVRTGCKCCPFSKNLQRELNTIKELLPKEYKQANYIWKPVFDEYKRIGYRLKNDKIIDIFDILEEEKENEK